ncbi:MAG: PLP-dependent aspartate aminotransferase family protein [Planctomycetota bacterium]
MARIINPNNTTGDIAQNDYQFQTVDAGTHPVLGWKDRAELIPGAELATQCVHAGVQPDPAHGAVMQPIYQSSTFAFRDICTNSGYDYTRSSNPTRNALEDAINTLEGGAGAVCTSTGMSAILVAMQLLDHPAHIICTNDCYGGTFRLLNHLGLVSGLEISYLDLNDLDAVKAAIKPSTKAIWIETPSNPLLNIVDIAALVKIAKEHKLLTYVDNTFMSPILQKPFEFGVDVVVHSTTKYLNGHSDVVGGCVVANPNDQVLADRVFAMANVLGVSQAPMDCFFVLRGIKTLELRMNAHEANARKIAAFLDAHDEVQHVYYPGLPTHPQHELAKKQQRGFGGMISFKLRSGTIDRVNRVLRATKLFTVAESLGGVESLICHPASMTHASMTKEARLAAGITDDIIRLSIGIEGATDLLADLQQALERVADTSLDFQPLVETVAAGAK